MTAPVESFEWAGLVWERQRFGPAPVYRTYWRCPRLPEAYVEHAHNTGVWTARLRGVVGSAGRFPPSTDEAWAARAALNAARFALHRRALDDLEWAERHGASPTGLDETRPFLDGGPARAAKAVRG